MDINENGCTLEDGTKITAQIVYKCMGSKPATESLGDKLGETVNSYGALKVNEFMQVEGYKNVFAIGDVMAHDSREWKLGMFIPMSIYTTG